MCFSNNLLTNESKDIGRYCEGLSVWSVVFGIGTTEDIFHAVGTLAAFMDMVSEGVMDSAVPFNMRPEMPSGPDALVVSIAHNKQNTSPSAHAISSLTLVALLASRRSTKVSRNGRV